METASPRCSILMDIPSKFNIEHGIGNASEAVKLLFIALGPLRMALFLEPSLPAWAHLLGFLVFFQNI
jgi:hypothetical protein